MNESNVVPANSHHWVGNGYAKIMSFNPGEEAGMHIHNRDHDSHLLLGSVIVTRHGLEELYNAPKVIKIRAGVEHKIKALLPVLWACVWTDCDGLTTDTFDESVIQKDG